jgi:hypothetical protein
MPTIRLIVNNAKLWLLCAFALTLLSIGRAQEVVNINLTAASVVEASERLGWWREFALPGIASMPRQEMSEIPIAVTTISVDRTNVRYGDTVIYEVTVKNIGKQALGLPISSDLNKVEPDKCRRPPCDYDFVSIFLSFESKAGRTVIGHGSVLYGSPKISHTWVVLSPGQWIRVKAKDVFVGGRLDALKSPPVSVRCEFNLDHVSVQERGGKLGEITTSVYAGVLSSNKIDVQLNSVSEKDEPAKKPND